MLKFTLDDKNGKSLLTPDRVPRFYSFEGGVKKYVDYQWTVEVFSSDSSKHYMLARTITGINNSTKTFFFNDSLGATNKVEAVIANNPSDPVCPGAYNLVRVTFNDQIKTAVIQDHVPHYQFHLL